MESEVCPYYRPITQTCDHKAYFGCKCKLKNQPKCETYQNIHLELKNALETP